MAFLPCSPIFPRWCGLNKGRSQSGLPCSPGAEQVLNNYLVKELSYHSHLCNPHSVPSATVLCGVGLRNVCGIERDGFEFPQVSTHKMAQKEHSCVCPARSMLIHLNVTSTGLGTQQGFYSICQTTVLLNKLRDLVVPVVSHLASSFLSGLSVLICKGEMIRSPPLRAVLRIK